MDFTTPRICFGNQRKKGGENVIADHLSRLENLDMEAMEKGSIKEEFPDKYIFLVSMIPWYADFANFLASDILPLKLSYQQQKKLF